MVASQKRAKNHEKSEVLILWSMATLSLLRRICLVRAITKPPPFLVGKDDLRDVMGFLEFEQVLVENAELHDFVQRRELGAIGCVILAVSLPDVPWGLAS